MYIKKEVPEGTSFPLVNGRCGHYMHNLLLVNGNASGQNVHGSLQILLFQHIGDTNLIDTLTRGFIEGCAGGEHDGIAVVAEALSTGKLAMT